VSIELQLRVHQQAVADDLPARFQRLTAIGVIKKMVEMSRCGRRSGGGFYEYPAGAQKRIWPGLCNLFPVSARQPSIDDLEFRLLSIQALEAARCWEEGVVGDPADADLGAVLGFGYPSWTGGPLSYIDMVGPKAIVERCERLASEYGERFMPPSDLRRRALSGATYYAT
jgi:3-hydroxyacyl-CoA dehydrogenase / enoyl-CoA hydratase / 3-hydroxybutyryl-CoA epimerase